ncbi:MAG: FeoC-like transcriptional regulator [Legionellales bacterium]|nr:FeoC-like transcriptional regulator [Legionellales bacterium]
MLSAIRNFIQIHRVVSVEQLSREFCIATEALGPMLEIWVNKGYIRKSNQKENCGTGCRSCYVQRVVYYEWCRHLSRQSELRPLGSRNSAC